MPVRDEVWVIEDENILSVREGKSGRPRKAAGPPPRRPSPMGEQAVPVAHRVATHSQSSQRPLIAAGLSILVCGGGQIFNGQRQLGVLFMVMEATVITFHWSATAMWGFLMEMGALFGVSEQAMLLSVAGLDTVLMGLVLISVAQAYRHAASGSGEFGGFGKPVVSGIASLLIPGMGQMVNAQLGKALCFFCCILAGSFATASLFLEPFGSYFQRINLVGLIGQQSTQAAAGAVFLAGALWVFSIYDAILVARYRER